MIVSYAVGSIPFSFLVAKGFSGKDIRSAGSGNVGATNVARNAGKAAGILALLLDLAKGWGAVIIARQIFLRSAGEGVATGLLASEAFWLGLSGFLAVAGHMFPVWLGFRGGKGVATGTGAFAAMSPLAISMGLIVFVIVILTSRYVSLASIVAAASVPIFMRFAVHAPFWIVIFSIFISMMVIVKHHSNIRRLATGSERKFPR